MEMEFTCLQENLEKGLMISRLSGLRRTTLPILQNYLLSVEKGTLVISSTNLDIGVRAYIRGKSNVDGSVSIPQDTLLAYVKNLHQDKINLKVSETKLSLKTETGFQAEFHGQSTEDFPPMPEFTGSHRVTLAVEDLKKALKLVSICLPKNDFRPEIAGVLFSKVNNSLILVGTDGFRLAEKNIPIDGQGTEDFRFVIPTKSVQEVNRILDLVEDTEATVVFGENQVLFTFSNVEVFSKLGSGIFPQYEGLIPQSFRYSISADRGEWIQLVKLASVFSHESVNDIKCTLSDSGVLEISSANAERGANSSPLTVEVEGEIGNVFQITFNYQYLLDGLHSFNSERVTLRVNDSDSPAIICSLEDPDFMYLVMPIRD
jgi:DNA polymerase-3 subunit beta